MNLSLSCWFGYRFGDCGFGSYLMTVVPTDNLSSLLVIYSVPGLEMTRVKLVMVSIIKLTFVYDVYK